MNPSTQKADRSHTASDNTCACCETTFPTGSHTLPETHKTRIKIMSHKVRTYYGKGGQVGTYPAYGVGIPRATTHSTCIHIPKPLSLDRTPIISAHRRLTSRCQIRFIYAVGAA